MECTNDKNYIDIVKCGLKSINKPNDFFDLVFKTTNQMETVFVKSKFYLNYKNYLISFFQLLDVL